MKKPFDLRQRVLERIRTFRSHKGYARHIGCSEAVVSRFVHGRPQEPTKKMLVDLLTVLLT